MKFQNNGINKQQYMINGQHMNNGKPMYNWLIIITKIQKYTP